MSVHASPQSSRSLSCRSRQLSSAPIRFTLAHELGHLVLHSFRQSADPETEAHLFAGAFLVPDSRAAELIPPDSTLQQLARVKAGWGVSIAALVKRGEAAGTIDKDRVSTLYRQISSRGWRKEEPVHVGAETPRLLFRLLQDRYGENPYAAERIEHELAFPVMTLRALAPAPAAVGRSTTSRPVAQLRAL
ncbi:ImmA/IrrE family metallo-endopeptidase [Microbacterium sp. CFH 31415]|uniref:ImmA/IrrE family metallo-endopeptidase n=1 Tax=Microbacterium sp. CFH 31415 TaxID=2921732 RepID=UPI001F13C364|nr:ImmA/IrrE family metallo-endopeptidase [Microbacterium sp. CFH 31415]MCH6229617.1 ImmA/IrrE family metallo-endopeptidase [Microbacterium sp. CFH 31415]